MNAIFHKWLMGKWNKLFHINHLIIAILMILIYHGKYTWKHAGCSVDSDNLKLLNCFVQFRSHFIVKIVRCGTSLFRHKSRIAIKMLIWSGSNVFINLAEKVENAWKKKTPKQKWHLLFEFVRYLGDLIQIRILSSNKVSPIGYIPVLAFIIHFILAAYTFYYYISRGSYSECLGTCCISGVAISVRTIKNWFESFIYINFNILSFPKSYSAYFTAINESRFVWHKLAAISGKYIYRDDHQPTAYNSICSKTIDQSLKTFVIKTSVIILSFVGAVLGPFLRFISDGFLYTLYELRIPYYNQYPYTEFVINVIWQIIISVIGTVGLFILEGGFTLINDTITVSSKISLLEFTQLSNLLENKQQKDRNVRRQLVKNYMNILYMDEWDQFYSKSLKIWCNYTNLRQFRRFTEEFGDLMYWRNFLSPPSFTFSISVSLYCQYMVSISFIFIRIFPYSSI